MEYNKQITEMKILAARLHSDYETIINGNVRIQIKGNKFYIMKRRARAETVDSNTIMKIAVKHIRTQKRCIIQRQRIDPSKMRLRSNILDTE